MLRAVENKMAIFEETTRAQQWYATNKLHIDKGLDPETAGLLADRAARWNTANFHRTGDTGRGINALFLYANAAKEGTRSWIRAARHNPAEFTTKALFLLAAPTAYFTYNNLSTEHNRNIYNDLDEDVKRNNHIWITPWAEKAKNGSYDGVYLLPVLRHGPGQAMSAMRHAMETAYGDDPKGFLTYLGDFVNAVIPFEKSTFMLWATKPYQEAMTYNRDGFTGREVVPRSEQNKPILERTSKKTTQLAKDLDVIPNKLHMNVSPPQIQHMAEGYFGRVPSNALAWAYDRAKGVPRKEGREDWLRGTIAKPFSAPFGGAKLRNYKSKTADKRDFRDSLF
jgi:hypothetical protein